MASEWKALYREQLEFEYTCVDRIHLRGHAGILQTCGGFRTWAERLRPEQPVTQNWIQSLARRFHHNVAKFGDEHGIPIVKPQKGQRKHLLADEYRSKFDRDEGVYLILKSFENAYLFISHEPNAPTTSHHRNLSRRWGFVAHYYFYLIDRHWGPLCIAICSHPPFRVRVLLNAHHWVERRAAMRQLQLDNQGNAFLGTEVPAKLQHLADSLTERDIQRVADRWTYRVLPVLTYKERHDSRFQYRWSIGQIELCHNLVFRSGYPLAELLQRHIDLNRRLLCPTSIATVFGKQKTSARQDLSVSVYQSHDSRTVLHVKHLGDTLKIYDKYDRILRNECVCNDPNRFGVGKLLTNFSLLKNQMTATLQRFLQLQHAVLDNTLDRGQLAALAQTSELGRSRVPGIKLENERILTALHVAAHLGTDPRGFTAAQLRDRICSRTALPYSASQASYDLRKLRAKAILEPLAHTHRYVLSRLGSRLTPVLYKLHSLFLTPSLALATTPSAPTLAAFPSKSRGPHPNPPPADLRSLLAHHAGNVSAVARDLGRQSCVVRRWIAREHLELQSFRTPVVRPDIEAAYTAVDDALLVLARAVALPTPA